MRDVPPIWIRHVHPVHARTPLRNNALDLMTLETILAPILMELDTERSFSVQTRLLGDGVQWQYSPYDVNERLAAQGNLLLPPYSHMLNISSAAMIAESASTSPVIIRAELSGV